MALAREIMETDVVTVTPDTPLLTLHRLLAQENISGAPVVEQTGEIVGVVSWRDLLRAVGEEHDAAINDLHYYSGDSSFDNREWMADLEEFEDRLSRRLVADVMTRAVISVPIDASIKEMAALMLQHRIHRVLVVDEENDEAPLVGLVSVLDLVAQLR